MAPLFFSIGNLPLMIIPDTEAHVDGHPALTYNYNVYRDNGESKLLQADSKNDELRLEKHEDPNYMGVITVEIPERKFTYRGSGNRTLSATEVEEVIENISHYRSHPDLWKY